MKGVLYLAEDIIKTQYIFLNLEIKSQILMSGTASPHLEEGLTPGPSPSMERREKKNSLSIYGEGRPTAGVKVPVFR